MPHSKNVTVIEFLPGGWSNQNFKVEVDGVVAVLRIKSRKPQKPGIEVNYLHSQLAPDLLGHDPETEDMITKWVDGDLFCDTEIDPLTAAEYLSHLHANLEQGITRYDVYKTVNQYLEGVSLDQDVRQVFEEIDWSPNSIVGCHNELNAWNVIKTQSGFCTLDWESAGDNDPIFDLVGLCYGLRFDDDQVGVCNEAYRHPASIEHLTRTRILYEIREHAWAADRIHHGSNKEEILMQLRDSKAEVLRLLARLS